MGKSVFNPKWTQTYKWLIKAEDRFKAFCTSCNKQIDLGKMGEGALKSHQKSEKHKFNSKSVQSVDIREMVIPPAPPPENSNLNKLTPANNLDTFVSKTDVLKSEVMWVLQTIVSHNSYKSNEEISNIFRAMFPDSKIAEGFKLGERKTSYLTVYGIGEFLKNLLLQQINGKYTVLFDESLNKKAQKKQMDIHVRFWVDNIVKTRYLTSVFLGHGCATDMVEHFMNGIKDLTNHKNMIQISMDGPSVNWKFFDLMKKEIQKDYDVSLINVGSCGLHVVNNAFKAGATSTSWGITDFLSSLYYLFKDSPARREDYFKHSG